MFCSSAATNLELLQASLSAGDTAQAHRHAHTILGAAANIAASRIRAYAAHLDEAAKRGDLSSAQKLLPAVEQEFERFKQEISD
jgi:HPt (histidine-containing phosphotransfer) domain-containing protein